MEETPDSTGNTQPPKESQQLGRNKINQAFREALVFLTVKLHFSHLSF